MYEKKEESDELQVYNVVKRLAIIFSEIFIKPLNEESLNNIKDFTNDIVKFKNEQTKKSQHNLLDSDNHEIMAALFQRLNYFLVECTNKQTSSVIRGMLKDIYDTEYSLDDYSLIDSVLLSKDYPKIYSKEIYTNASTRELKEVSDLFTTYVSEYPYDKYKSHSTLVRINESSGRLRMHEGFFLWFSDYFELYERTNDLLMKDDYLMPLAWKYYLAIMAVSTIRCEYLLRDLEMNFLLKGGDESWLVKGLNAVPEKLKMLEKVNNLLAHQPWKFKLQDLTEIYYKYNNKGWNNLELIHAIIILTNFHRLATVVESMRFNVRPPSPNTKKEKTPEEKINLLNNGNMTKTNSTNDDKISLSSPHRANNLPNKDEPHTDSLSYQTEHNKDINIVECDINKLKLEDSASVNVKKMILNELEIINKNEKTGKVAVSSYRRKPSEEKVKVNTSFDSFLSETSKDFAKHTSSFCTVYLDFDSHSEEYYSYIEFNWQDHASYILQNFHPTAVDAVNEEIDYITSISSNNIGGEPKKIDTAQYRHTICCYVEKIFGISNESFDYSKTNKLLHRTHKQFIKNIACFPQKITKMDIAVLKVTFSPEEIYHIIMLVAIAKMRLQLTFFTKHLYEIIKSID